jgi:pyruvate kinase
LSWRATKIVCTLGPATDAPGVLEALVAAGMDVARINLSHGTLDEHARRIAQVRETSRKSAHAVAILADLPGPKYRLGEIPGGSRELRDGTRVVLAQEAAAADELPIAERALLEALRAGECVYLADGAIRLKVTSTAVGRVACEVVAGGTVHSGSGVNVPQLDMPGIVPTEHDRALLTFAVAHGVDWIGVSFVQHADDLARVRACLPDRGAAPLLMAKIEKRRAVETLDAVVEAADGVMVARGDLGVETDVAEIPLVQKRIIAAANARARPVVTATQMLESMVEHERPTRAEVTDIANAVLDGTDAVMLSAESAIGKQPLAAVHVLRRVIAATLGAYAPAMARARLEPQTAVPGEAAVGFAACQLAERLGARAIIAHVQGLSQAAAIARFRPRAPIVALAPSGACRALTLISGVVPLGAVPGSEAVAGNWLYANGLASPGDPAVVVSSSPEAGGNADTLRVVRLPARSSSGF